MGGAPRPVADYRFLAGQGAEYLVRTALDGADERRVEAGVAAFRAYYAAHPTDFTEPYRGIPEALDALVGRGHALAVLSNKPEEMVHRVVETCFGRWPWRAVRGARPDAPLKPDPAAALAIAAELGIAPSDWIYVGDTATDMQTARAAGMRPVGVAWGFRPESELWAHGAERVVRSPRELTGESAHAASADQR